MKSLLLGVLLSSSLFANQSFQELSINSMKALESTNDRIQWEQSPLNSGKLFIEQMRKSPKELCDFLENAKMEELLHYSKEILDYQSFYNCLEKSAEKVKIILNAKATNIDIQQFASFSTFNLISNIENIEFKVPVDQAPEYLRANLPNGQFAFTFDDGPHPSNSKKILDILDNFGVKATYFAIGRNVNAYPNIAKETMDRGHSYGSHSMNHLNLPKQSNHTIIKEIIGGHDLVVKTVGKNFPFFRYPYGARTKWMKSLLKENKLSSFLWNIDTLDWKYKNPEVLYNNIIKQINTQKGGIILFHDIHPQTVTVLPRVLNYIQSNQYKTVLFIK